MKIKKGMLFRQEGFNSCVDRYERIIHAIKSGVIPWSHRDYDNLQIRSKSDIFNI